VWYRTYGAWLYRRGLQTGRRLGPAPSIPKPPKPEGPSTNDLETFYDNRVVGRGIWKWRHYFEVYDRHFARFRNRPVRILEIGIYSGGSLDMWQDYFGEQCEIIGIDIEDGCKVYERDNVEVVIGNQADRTFWQHFKEAVGPVDIIVDDGGHLPMQQTVTLEEILSHLRPGGVYVCEDIYGRSNPFLSYLNGLGRALHDFNIDLTDDAAPGTVPNSFQKLAHSIHLYPFIAVIETQSHTIDNFVSPRRGTEWQPWM
jgi:SAM-dependent methyltransferase